MVPKEYAFVGIKIFLLEKRDPKWIHEEKYGIHYEQWSSLGSGQKTKILGVG